MELTGMLAAMEFDEIVAKYARRLSFSELGPSFYFDFPHEI
jgi:hypothetical protein